MSDDGLRLADGGLLIRVRVTPNARREGLVPGEGQLEAKVTVPPEKGRANAALVALLARTWRLPRTSLEVVSGATGRMKTVRVAGDAEAARRAVAEWMVAEREGKGSA
ncbi:DUF167 domain-containing protein [Futiania mangrovi]|uniref:UPF0235 protein NJQ99_09325 n=1 Tax=Futiania mangrovi TaxID=2959716 RepID=A0A9J6PBK4_9PROT|nr:DUF167 family protein [Futiania mangrovii]MCP1336605.1 DUF167 family protein [Futiania mangrovii]